ncbi:LysR family transcriptional regulator [Microbulbifer echini]|uniref:LysR family transcriptional regulator n=1 Tax=Microbulbifer echini TaxID=1529067 RepID=A0ABV4NQA8_9GAMM|nr:LysR family transcriptional regulator [uncultured Microbulbifer sp.]
MNVRDLETISFRTLSVFVHVCRTLNLSLVADQLELPKSTVSKEVSRLESHLKAKLLDRTTRRVALTEVGAIAYERALHLVEDFKTMQNDVLVMDQQVQGLLRISAPPALGEFLSKKVMPAFLKRWPKITISLNLTYDFEDLFSQGIDLAFRVGDIHDERLISRKLGSSTRILVASVEYLTTHGTPKLPEELVSHNCLRFQFNPGDTEWTLTSDQSTINIPVNGNFFCANVSALKNAAVNGVGIAQLPINNIMEELDKGLLINILPNWHVPPMDIHAVYRTGLNKPKKLAALLDFLKEEKNLFKWSI